MTAPLDWDLVKNAATDLCVNAGTFHQWKSRNWVPPLWWPKIVRATEGRISTEALESLVPRMREGAE